MASWAEREVEARSLEIGPQGDAIWHAIHATIQEAARRVCTCGHLTGWRPLLPDGCLDGCPALKVLAMGGK